MLGLLVGILGGPIGVLIGGSYGLLIGSLFDLSDGERIESTLGQLSESVQPERTAVLTVVTEPSPDVIDAAMAPFGGTVLRRSVYDGRGRGRRPPGGRAQGDPRGQARADARAPRARPRRSARQGRGAEGEARVPVALQSLAGMNAAASGRRVRVTTFKRGAH